jgi:hypothetical protein
MEYWMIRWKCFVTDYLSLKIFSDSTCTDCISLSLQLLVIDCLSLYPLLVSDRPSPISVLWCSVLYVNCVNTTSYLVCEVPILVLENEALPCALVLSSNHLLYNHELLLLLKWQSYRSLRRVHLML